VPGNTLISSYLAGLSRRLPAGLADEVADGLAEAYEHHLARGDSEDAAARTALTETGDLDVVVGAFTRHAPGRRTARTLLATGPIIGACWGTALITARAWAWLLPTAASLRSSAAPGDRGPGHRRHQQAQLPADPAHCPRRARPGHPGRHDDHCRAAGRTGPHLAAGHRHHRQPRADDTNRGRAASDHHYLTAARKPTDPQIHHKSTPARAVPAQVPATTHSRTGDALTGGPWAPDGQRPARRWARRPVPPVTSTTARAASAAASAPPSTVSARLGRQRPRRPDQPAADGLDPALTSPG
jgi:hypothetical protein